MTIIDAEPNKPFAQWAGREGRPEDVLVTVDLEGTASMMVAYAISRADLVVIPTQGSQLDAARAVKLTRQQEKAWRVRSARAVTRRSSRASCGICICPTRCQ